MKEYLQTTDAVLDKVGSSGTGLTGAEAAARRRKTARTSSRRGQAQNRSFSAF